MKYDELEKAIADITDRMRRPIGNIERHNLFFERQALRQERDLIDCRIEAKVDGQCAAHEPQEKK